MLKLKVLGSPAAGHTYGNIAQVPPLDRKDYRVMGAEEDVTAVRQQHRNVFVERCRLMHLPIPAMETLDSWWPGTKPVFA